MCGFPGAVIADKDAYGDRAAKTMVGMVQQIKHYIAISSNSGEASTSVVMNDVRFIDEPTDIDEMGMPLYMEATDPNQARIYPNTLDHLKFNKNGTTSVDDAYGVPEPLPRIKRRDNSTADKIYYDLDPVYESKNFIYAKDFITLTARQMGKGAKNTSYLDVLYDPQHISKFYKNVFGQKNHFMIGYKKINDQDVYFTYTTLHEALERLRDNPDLMRDYEECMKYVQRDICTAEQYFHAILGLSSQETETTNGSTKTIFKNRTTFNHPDVVDKEYYGVSTELWESSDPRISGLKGPAPGSMGPTQGLMMGPGEFSSITEHMPFTAFIAERHQKVKNYLLTATKWAEGVQVS
jgi:hypothetical protein